VSTRHFHVQTWYKCVYRFNRSQPSEAREQQDERNGEELKGIKKEMGRKTNKGRNNEKWS
jgi:hypothetical protein